MSAKHPDWDWDCWSKPANFLWLTNRFGADWKFLAHFYRTGEKIRFEAETGADEPLLTSIPIPSFVPQRWPPRGSF